jgi:O-antigen ligase
MTALLLLIFALLCLAAFGYFLYLERRGRPVTVIVFLTALLVVESALYSSPNEVATGLLHPAIGSLSFRVFDILVPLAAIARLLAGRDRGRMHPGVMWWMPFVVWMLTAAIIGAVSGNSATIITFEAKLVVYLLMIPLAAGVPARQYVEDRGVRRLVVLCSGLATLLVLTQFAGISISAAIPLLPLDGLGVLGSDLASVFVAMGTVVMAVALVSRRGRGWLVLVALPLLICPVPVGQRAALVGLIVSIGALALAVPFGRRAVRTTPTEVALVLAVGIGLIILPTFAPAVTEQNTNALPLASLTTPFTNRAKQLSGEDRVYQWRKARVLIAARPVFGYGLGFTYVTWDPGYYTFRVNFLTHNIVGDLLLRTGVVGLILFLIPVALALGLCLRGWRELFDPRMAAITLGAGAAVTGLLAKGLFESIFEKYRLALFLAILVGVIVAMDRELRRPANVTLRLMEGSR